MSNSEAATDTAKQEAGNVAATAKGEAANVASAAQEQARNVLDDARTMMDDQSRTQRDRVVRFTRSMSDDLEQMAQNGPPGTTADMARQVADKVRGLGDRLDGREPRELLDEVRNFARQRPGTFLLGALAAGVVAGRFARGSKDARSSSNSVRAGSGTGMSTAGATPTRVGEVGPVPGYSTGTPDALGETGHGTTTDDTLAVDTTGTRSGTAYGETATSPITPLSEETEPPLYVETTERQP